MQNVAFFLYCTKLNYEKSNITYLSQAKYEFNMSLRSQKVINTMNKEVN
jgi:hypothetical protein